MSTFGSAKNNLLLTDIVPSMPQLLDDSKSLQNTHIGTCCHPSAVSRNCLSVVSGGIRRINRFREEARTLRCYQLE